MTDWHIAALVESVFPNSLFNEHTGYCLEVKKGSLFKAITTYSLPIMYLYVIIVNEHSFLLMRVQESR